MTDKESFYLKSNNNIIIQTYQICNILRPYDKLYYVRTKRITQHTWVLLNKKTKSQIDHTPVDKKT